MIVYSKRPELHANPTSQERLAICIRQVDGPERHTVKFRGGRAEVPDHVGRFLLDKGYAVPGFEKSDGKQLEHNVLEDLLEAAIDKEVVTKKGAWFYAGDTKIGQGKAQAIEYLAGNEQFTAELRRAVFPPKDEE